MAMQQIPVYAFTGFLDSGKTKFIQETLEDPRFNAGERTLVLIFEEGEEEYDLSTYPYKNVYLEVLDQQTVSTEELKALQKKYKAERVVAELNGMQQVGDLYMRFPSQWAIAQEVMFADSTTIMAYNANMRNLVMDKLVGAQMVVFNRMTPGADVMPFHKLARAANRRIDILYDYTDGTTKFDEIEDPLPFDINAPVIEVKDEDYALWYRDVSEEPEKYSGKTVHFKAQVAMLRRDKNNMFAPGRFVMTCCVEDIQFCGIPCRYDEASKLESRSWVMVTAKITAEEHPLYKGDVGPMLTALSVETGAQPADPDVATF
jgi:G3E family GTPase-like protein